MTLEQYLSAFHGSRFQWGTHDCMTFVNGWVFAVTGSGFYDPELFPYRTERAAAVAYRNYCRHYGYESFEAYFDVAFERVLHVPGDGAIVARRLSEESATGSRMGIMTGRSVAFVGTENLTLLPYDPNLDRGWTI